MANASTILSDDMTLQEKLDAIDAAMKAAQEQASEESKTNGNYVAPVDPQDFLMCQGCQ